MQTKQKNNNLIYWLNRGNDDSPSVLRLVCFKNKAHALPLTDLLSLSRKTEPLLSHRASLTGDRQNGDEKVSESEPMVLSRLTSSDSSQEPSSPSSPAESRRCWWERASRAPSPTRLWLSVEVLQVMFLSSSSASSGAAGGRERGLERMDGFKIKSTKLWLLFPLV